MAGKETWWENRSGTFLIKHFGSAFFKGPLFGKIKGQEPWEGRVGYKLMGFPLPPPVHSPVAPEPAPPSQPDTSCICSSLAMLEVNLEGVQKGGQEALHCS